VKILIVTLAESANIGSNGRLHIRGVVDTLIASRGFPYTLPPMSLVLRFELDHNDRAGDHAIRVDVLDGHGKVVSSIPGTYRAPWTDSGHRVVENTILPILVEEPIKSSGRLSLDVFWDDQKQQSLAVEVIESRG
jgi:hypothetical protein